MVCRGFSWLVEVASELQDPVFRVNDLCGSEIFWGVRKLVSVPDGYGQASVCAAPNKASSGTKRMVVVGRGFSWLVEVASELQDPVCRANDLCDSEVCWGVRKLV